MYVKSWWILVKTKSWKLAYEVQVPVHRQHWMNYLKTKQVSCKHTDRVECVLLRPSSGHIRVFLTEQLQKNYLIMFCIKQQKAMELARCSKLTGDLCPRGLTLDIFQEHSSRSWEPAMERTSVQAFNNYHYQIQQRLSELNKFVFEKHCYDLPHQPVPVKNCSEPGLVTAWASNLLIAALPAGLPQIYPCLRSSPCPSEKCTIFS